MPRAYHFNREALTLRPADAECEQWLGKQPAEVWLRTVARGKQRTLSQNALQWRHYGVIGAEYGLTPEDVHKEVKLRHGVPILCRDDEAFARFYESHFAALPYMARVRAMEYLQVTSLFTTAQAAEYTDAYVQFYAEHGLVLPMPEDIIYEARSNE